MAYENRLPSVSYTVEADSDSHADIAERARLNEVARLKAVRALRLALIDSGAIVPHAGADQRGLPTPFVPSNLPCIRLDEKGRRLAAERVEHELMLIANPALRWAEQREHASERRHRDPLSEFINRRQQAA